VFLHVGLNCRTLRIGKDSPIVNIHPLEIRQRNAEIKHCPAWYFESLQTFPKTFAIKVALNIRVCIVFETCKHTLLCSLSMEVIARVVNKVELAISKESLIV